MAVCQKVSHDVPRWMCLPTSDGGASCWARKNDEGELMLRSVTRRVCASDAKDLERIISGYTNVRPLSVPKRSTSLLDRLNGVLTSLITKL